MADEDDLLGGMDDVGEEEEEEEQEGGFSLMKYLPIIGGVLVVQIIIGYVLVSWLFSPSDDAPEAEGGVVEEVRPTRVEVIEESIYDKLDVIVVNPAGTGGLRFLSTEVHLGLASPEIVAEIDAKKLVSRIRDRLISVFQSKTIDQLEPERHDEIKEEIMEKLNSPTFLGKNAVIAVYFQGFVIQ